MEESDPSQHRQRENRQGFSTACFPEKGCVGSETRMDVSQSSSFAERDGNAHMNATLEGSPNFVNVNKRFDKPLQRFVGVLGKVW